MNITNVDVQVILDNAFKQLRDLKCVESCIAIVKMDNGDIVFYTDEGNYGEQVKMFEVAKAMAHHRAFNPESVKHETYGGNE